MIELIIDKISVLLIVCSIIFFSIETLPDLTANQKHWLEISEATIVGLFTVEYFIRIWIAEKKLAFVFSFYGLIDLISILPFYFAPALDLQTLRIVRLFRVIRILKLTRYRNAIGRLYKAILIAKEEMILFFSLTAMLLYLSAVGIYHFEHAAQPENFRSIFDGLWWAVATLTTVGYGDVYPITIGGKIFTFIILMLGLGIVAIPTGLFACALSSVRKSEASE